MLLSGAMHFYSWGRRMQPDDSSKFRRYRSCEAVRHVGSSTSRYRLQGASRRQKVGLSLATETQGRSRLRVLHAAEGICRCTDLKMSRLFGLRLAGDANSYNRYSAALKAWRSSSGSAMKVCHSAADPSACDQCSR